MIHTGRATTLQSTFTRQAQFNAAPGSAVLYSDDVLRGYRVDVNDRGTWRSLCARTGTLSLNGATRTISIADEGYVKAVTATKKDMFPFELYVHEALFGWDNWSLVAPHPGKTTSDPADPDFQTGVPVKPIANTNVDPATGAALAFPFSVTTDMHATAGTLPRLRFGSTYQFRARAVDLAGNSLPTNGVPNSHATPAWRYLRFEPVLSPAIVPTARFTLGESPEHLVIRDGQTPPVARFLAPPKASQLEVEIHGKLDPLLASPSTFAGAFDLSAKEQGSFSDAAFFGTDPNAVIVTNDLNVAPVLVGAQTGARGTALSPPGAYVIYTGLLLPLPYLPDPLATGIAVFVDPNAPPTVRAYSGSSFDTLAPIRFELHATTAATPIVSSGAGGDAFTVGLPPATILEVDYASTMPADALAYMAAWQNGGSAALKAADATSGQSPYLMGHRTMRLVHAVKQPIAPASLTGLVLSKNPSDTFVTLVGATLNVHSRSTGDVEIGVEWTEIQDLVGAPPAVAVPRKTFAYRTSVGYGSDSVALPVVPSPAGTPNGDSCPANTGAPSARIDFGDTKHRSVQFRCTSSTRYGEYYDPADVADPSQTTLSGPLSEAIAVLNSGRAPKPDVAYVVPTLNWQGSDAPGSLQHDRLGGTVRIYLNRPWFATGDGELLAVIVANVADGAQDAADAVRPYISEWGFDPIYNDLFSTAGNVPFTTLTASRFSSGTAGAPVQLVELAPSQPSVVPIGHVVQYSAERDLWFVDIALDMGESYSPFVRFSVARYQPSSLPGLELSGTVRIDCIQLTARRTATIARSGTSLTVTMTGQIASNFFGLGSGIGHAVTATIDSRMPGGGELDWTPVPGTATTVPIVATDPVTAAVTWGATFANAPTTNGAAEYRLRIEESEVFASDDLPNAGHRPVHVDTFSI